MAAKKSSSAQQLRRYANGLAATEEGVACDGTALEKRTIKTNKKAFLFLGMSTAMLKLEGSLPAATKLAKKDPKRCKVGANGWVTVAFEDTDLQLLKAWIRESHALFSRPASAKLSPTEAARAFRRAGMLSLWVGRFESEDELEAYIDGGLFERDAGYAITRGLEPFHAHATSPTSLFAGYGFSPGLVRRAVKAFRELGVDANAAVLQDDFCFQPDRARSSGRARMTFLGTFRKP